MLHVCLSKDSAEQKCDKSFAVLPVVVANFAASMAGLTLQSEPANQSSRLMVVVM